MSPIPQRLAAALAALLLLAGCELAEVTTTGGVDLLVVEAVLRAGEPRQEVLLHRTLQGGTVRGEAGARVAIAGPEGVEAPLDVEPLAACTGPIHPQLTDSTTIDATCYATRPGELEVRPGATYELRVETGRGEVVRGRTTVPGDYRLGSPEQCVLAPRTPLELAWSRSAGAWSYLAAAQVWGLGNALQGTGIVGPEPLELNGLAISESDTTMVVPGDLGLFERFGSDQELLIYLQEGFPVGVGVQIVVAAADRNYVNAVRGGDFNPSGSVRVSSVVGDGIGVFGSLVPRRLSIYVSDVVSGPAC